MFPTLVRSMFMFGLLAPKEFMLVTHYFLFRTTKNSDLIDDLYDGVVAHYRAKNEKIALNVFQQLKHVHETMPQFKNIQFQITDGIKETNILVNLKEAYESMGVVVNTIDPNIKD